MKNIKKRISHFITQRPFGSFFLFLFLLLLLIVLSNMIGIQKATEKKDAPPSKVVRVYTIGSVPKLSVQAQVEKSGTLTVSSLTGGVVKKINVEIGQQVEKGVELIELSNNFQGENALSLARQISYQQYKTAQDNYGTQKDAIELQQKIAEKTHVSAEDLRNINERSIAGISSLVSLNGEILSSLDLQLQAATDSATLLQIKQLKSQFLAANNQAQAALESTRYQTSDDNAPAQLANLQKNLTMRQLEIQQRMLDMNLEIARLQFLVAQVNENTMFPAAPISGVVQRIFVKAGQAVSPGTPLIIITQTAEDPITAIAYVSADIARRVSLLEQSVLHLPNLSLTLYPSYVTQEAIQKTLYGIYFNIPENFAREVAKKGYIQIDLPIGHFDTTAVVPYIPIDAVYQTKDQSYIFIVNKGKAVAQSITLGNVYGSFVEVEKGLRNKDQVILDRNVIAGDNIKIIQ